MSETIDNQKNGKTKNKVITDIPSKPSKQKKQANTMIPIVDYHKWTIEQVYEHLHTSEKGLTAEERNARKKVQGANILDDKNKKPAIYYFFKAQFDMFAGLLWIATLICFVIYGVATIKKISGQDYNLYLGIVLIAINLFGGFLTFAQTIKAQRTLASFKQLLPSKCFVLINNMITEIAASELVTGDVVLLKAGEKVSADLRLIEVSQLKIDMSSFTGEAEPQPRSLSMEENIQLNAPNMAFYTCPVVNGDGRGVVVEIGNNTQIGHQKQIIQNVKEDKTPLQKEISRFVHFIMILSISVGGLFFILAFALGVFWIEALIFAIAIIVANVPEGLPLCIIVSLSNAAKRLAKKNVLVKGLNDVETLGSVSVIASDKTGTITRNQMTASHVYDNSEIKEIEWNFNEQKAECEIGEIIQKIIVLNSRAEFDENDLEKNVLKRRVRGDASEQGIFRFCVIQLKEEVFQMRLQNRKKFEIPFSSLYKFQLSAHYYDETQDLITVKGAPEKIFQLCKYVLVNNVVEEKTSRQEQSFNAAYEKIAGLGERLIGLAYCTEPTHEQYESIDDITTDIVFAGFISLVDPPKDGVKEAVAECHTASIQVAMVTGDHYLTAAAIARQVGIISGEADYFIDSSNIIQDNNNMTEENKTASKDISVPDTIVVQENQDESEFAKVHADEIDEAKQVCGKLHPHIVLLKRLSKLPQIFVPRNPSPAAVMVGDFLHSISDDQLMIFLDTYKEVVFARTTPEQKIRIVTQYQKLFKIVAATGDGLNDAPALKKADVGVAMASGSSVAQDSAKIILVDDSFATIVNGIKEGRIIFENLKKSMSYAITTTMPELIPFLLFVVCGFPNVLSSVIIVLIDIATSIWPSFAMGFEAGEADLMKRPPRTIHDKMFSRQLCWNCYIRIGMFQTIAEIIMFVVVICLETSKWTGVTFPLSLLCNFQHKDFLTHTLYNLYAPLFSVIDKSKLPSHVKDYQQFAKYVYYKAQSAAFVSIVETQLAHALVTRTRQNSFIKQGFFTNPWVYYTILIMLALGCVFVYVPPFQNFLQTARLDGIYWAICLPFPVWLFFYDEMRKFVIRRLSATSKLRNWLYW